MKQKAYILLFSVLIGLITTSFICHSKAGATTSDIQAGLAEKVIRFHVLANSDSDEDQQLKMKVKETVLSQISDILATQTLEESKEYLTSHTDEIIAIAKQVIAENGYDYNVTAQLCNTYFPTKSYGDITFPPGEYQAFEIIIGNGEGKNWWCVMYPPLCFVDASHGVLPDSSKEQLESILTDDEFKAISIANYDQYKIKYRFKYLTFLNQFID